MVFLWRELCCLKLLFTPLPSNLVTGALKVTRRLEGTQGLKTEGQRRTDYSHGQAEDRWLCWDCLEFPDFLESGYPLDQTWSVSEEEQMGIGERDGKKDIGPLPAHPT